MSAYLRFDESLLLTLIPVDLNEATRRATRRLLESQLSHSSLHWPLRQVIR
jgi:hypothetical protein